MTNNRRLFPVGARRLHVCASLFAVAVALSSLLAGCGGKPKPSAPGYFEGQIKGKGTPTKAAPAVQ